MSIDTFVILAVTIFSVGSIATVVATFVVIYSDKSGINFMKTLLIFISACLITACITLVVGAKSYISAMKPIPECPYCDTVLDGESPKVTLEVGDHTWNHYTCPNCGYEFKVEMWAPIAEIGRIVEYEL